MPGLPERAGLAVTGSIERNREGPYAEAKSLEPEAAEAWGRDRPGGVVSVGVASRAALLWSGVGGACCRNGSRLLTAWNHEAPYSRLEPSPLGLHPVSAL